MSSDFFYGWLKGKQTGTVNSAKGAVGVMKKVSYWVVIALAFGVAQVLIDFGAEIGAPLDFLRLIGWFTLGVYILNELTSIVENLVVLGSERAGDFRARPERGPQRCVDAAGDRVVPKEDDNANP